MNKEDTYKELTRILSKSEVEFTKKEDVAQSVLSKISKDRNRKDLILKSFYSWTEVKWLRWSISTAAVLFIAIFFSQQVLISQRLNKLEGQLVKTENSIQATNETITPSHRVILNLITNRNYDSVTVSKKDLEALFTEYMHLKEEMNTLKHGTDLEYLINSHLEEQTSSETNQNL